jgi:two-component system response regulator PilR (NtrC family)
MGTERLLIIDDDSSLREFLPMLLERDGYQIKTAATGEEGLELFDGWHPDIIITDLTMPGINGLEVLRRVKVRAAREGRDVPVLLLTAYATVSTAVEAMREGAFDYITKPFINDDLRQVVSRALAMQRLSEDNARLRLELGSRYQLGQLVGTSEKMQQVYSLVRKVMGFRINCLITGESGTGKELVARAIHYGSDRAQGAFIPVNCGAIPENLFESELFGHRKGSFTGAIRDKQGFFAAAHGGTLFLDEVGDLPLALQVKVLRALQEKKITIIGDTSETAVDVRVVAATNRNLETEVKEGRFREDLYYRLNVVQVTVPPLRERQEDIPALAHHFLEKFNEEFGKNVKGIGPEAMALLKGYAYPGNVRELQNIIERAVALEVGTLISPVSLPERVQGAIPVLDEEEEFSLEAIDLEARLNGIERRYLEQALSATSGNRTQAARLLGITFRSLRYRLAKFDMDSGE